MPPVSDIDQSDGRALTC